MGTILAGDIGGTKTRLALYSREGERLIRNDLRQYDSRHYPKFRDIVTKFLAEVSTQIDCACIGVAGPVVGGAVRAVNLPWHISESELSANLGVSRVRLVNDLVATTAAVPCFGPDDILTIHEGKPGLERHVAAVIAPGTGLGQGFLHWVDGIPHAVASEGGHADFAPTNELEASLLRFLIKKFQRASYERVLSGPGLVNIYQFLKESAFAPETEEVAGRLREEDAPAVISEFGLSGKDALCSKALDVFCSVLGAQAGNLMLTLMATGGVYLGGGIPPKILPRISGGILIAAYLCKGRLSKLVASTPLYLIRDDHAALLGAASIASRLV